MKLEKLDIKVVNIKDYSRASAGPDHEKKLCDYVVKENPNMFVIAWCHSLNGGDSFYGKSHLISRYRVVHAPLKHRHT